LSAKHTHEELRDTPIVDKACCLLMANNEIVMDLLEAGDRSRPSKSSRVDLGRQGLWRQAVNPGGVTAWKWGKDAKIMSNPSTATATDPAQIVAGLARLSMNSACRIRSICIATTSARQLRHDAGDHEGPEGHRPHMAHLHPMPMAAAIGNSCDPRRRRLPSISTPIQLICDAARSCSATPHGHRGRSPATLCTSSPAANGNLDVENETGCGIVPYTYKGSNLVNAVQWAVGLELLLLINDPWRVFLTTDHPNGACFWRYPEIIHLLMNADFRRERVRALPAKALGRMILADLDRQYTLYEIAIITSAGPARALGLTQKGHLGVGADADLTIYNENPDGELMFRYPRYVIKGGEIVVEEGDIRNVHQGREFITPVFDERSRIIPGRCSSKFTRCHSKIIRSTGPSSGRRFMRAK
jgi:formylmethanofuran dehydrogenase subunit A